jgi:chemotaxis protein MotB
MAKDVAPIIIKKRKGGHGGAHGGAWKVAFADFMTAMMAFFLVMWLMGSDEETKSSVANYFNNPTSPWRRDVAKDTRPLGDMTGSGDSVNSGSRGLTPDDLANNQMRPIVRAEVEGNKVGEILESFLTSESLMSLDMIRFSIPESALFQTTATDQWTPGAEKVMNKLGVLAQKYKGQLIIESAYSPRSEALEGSFEFQMSRVVSVQRYVVGKNWVREDRIATKVIDTSRSPASENRAESLDGKIQFTLFR